MSSDSITTTNNLPKIDIAEILSEAWQLTKGRKWDIWLCLLASWALIIVVSIGMSLLTIGEVVVKDDSNSLVDFIASLLLCPIYVGIQIIGVEIARGKSVAPSILIENYGNRIFPAALTYLLTAICVGVGFLCFIIPGIYLIVSYMLVFPVLVYQKLGAWQALETSRKAITPNWFQVATIYFVMWVCVMISAIPFGIGLIWTIPWGLTVNGVLYNKLFPSTETPVQIS